MTQLAEGQVVVSEGRAPMGGVMAGATRGLRATEAVPVELSERQIADIVRAELGDARAAAEEYRQSGHDGRAARLVAQADVLAALLDGV